MVRAPDMWEQKADWYIGRLAMMGRDWRLRTATYRGLFFHPRVIFDVDHGWWYWLGLTPNLSTIALWPPVLDGFLSAETFLAATSTVWFPAIRDVSGASGRMGEGNENLVYPSLWDFKRSFTSRKILWHETSGFTSQPKEGVLRIFIALAGLEPATFGFSGKHCKATAQRGTTGDIDPCTCCWQLD
jgi:hypothetical protein